MIGDEEVGSRAQPYAALAVIAESHERSLLKLATAVLRRRVLILSLTGAGVLIATGVTLLPASKFTARGSFMPQAPEPPAPGLVSLAGQFGIDISSGTGGQSPQFYADLLKSRGILESLAGAPISFFVFNENGDSAAVDTLLYNLLELEPRKSAEVRQAAAIEWLRDESIAVSTDRETGVVSFDVTSPYADLSEYIANRLVFLVDDFNLRSRQSQAAAERVFIEARLEEARSQLTSAEDRLKAFLENNRRFQTAPELVFEYNRLEREVGMQQQVYGSLIQAYEQARIAEVRNTPLLTMIDVPDRPVEPNPRGLLRNVLLGLILALISGVVVARIGVYWDESLRTGGPAGENLRTEWRSLRADFARILSRRASS